MDTLGPVEIIEKLKWAVNLYAQAGDEKNTKKQYLAKSLEARQIIMCDVLPALVQMRDEAEGE